MHELRAPPLSTRFGARPAITERVRRHARLRCARWAGLGLGLLWTGILLAILLALGRVPWLEAVLWSTVSGTVLGRTGFTSTLFVLRRAAAHRQIELGMDDPQAYRDRVARALAWLGYRPVVTRLGADRFEHRFAPVLIPPVRVAWAGAGAVLEGPRWALRAAVRQAVA